MGFINVSLGGALVALAVAAVTTTELVPVDQGWTIAEKAQWHSLSQGSRLIPRAWLMALERPDVDRPFLQPGHIDSFRYLIDPTPLPVGFVVDDQSDRQFSDVSRLRWKKGQGEREPWVGMNCAACHTAELTFKGKRMRIEGAPALADFQSFMQSMNGALATTLSDQRKWDRFSGQVLAGADDAGNRGMLRDAVESMLRWQTRVEQANHTDLQYGFARVDAFGHIFNKILLKTGGAGQPINPSDAPVSYPFLWNTSQHDVVQWNGMASNNRIGAIDIGALGRNVGEVTGVFADLAFTAPGTATARNGYQTSAHVKNLLTLDTLVRKLKAPAWPEALPPIDADKWEAGKLLFNQANGCASCHQVLERNDLTTRFAASLTPIFGNKPLGTDPWMACNAYAYQAMTGVLYNTRERLFIGRRYGQIEQLSDLLGTTVIGAIFNRRDEVIDAAVDRQDMETILVSANFFNWDRPLSLEDAGAVRELFEQDKEKRLQRCMRLSDDSRMAYKGRPLTGVWATAPYLHNGAVATLYDLLLPPERRPRSFRLGTREFDPVKVGFVTGEMAENSFVFATHDAAGQAIAGNSNLGHDYGNAGFTDAQRWALVEYMKAIGARREGSKIIP